MTLHSKKSRRTFLATGFATALGVAGCSSWQQTNRSTAKASQDGPVANPKDVNAKALLLPRSTLPMRQLGRTNVSLPVLGLGGAGKTPLNWPKAEEEAVQQVERALELGIRYFDTAASYGPSETFLGKVLPTYREEIFLASKTAGRDYDSAWRDLEQSLTRLNTDYLDLWQFHHVSFESDLDTIFGNDGAIKALEEAKAQGLVRFGGITGHHEPDIIAAGLQRYPFDHALIPVNAADTHHPRPFIPGVLPMAQAQNVGITAMKVPAYGRLFKPGGLDGMNQALGYTLSQSGVHCAVIAAETMEQLEENVQAAQSFQPLEAADLADIERRTATVWEDNTFFRDWT